MIIGDVVRIKIKNNNQKMVIEEKIYNVILCTWFDDKQQLHREKFYEENLISNDDYDRWNNQNMREDKLKRILGK